MYGYLNLLRGQLKKNTDNTLIWHPSIKSCTCGGFAMSGRDLCDKDVRLQRDGVPSAQSSQLHWLHLLSHRTAPTLTHPLFHESALDVCMSVCVKDRAQFRSSLHIVIVGPQGCNRSLSDRERTVSLTKTITVISKPEWKPYIILRTAV